MRGLALLFAFGAVVGSALDAIHTHSGTTIYPHPWVLEMAWWTPLLFGLAGIAVGATYPIYERVTGRTLPRPRRSQAASAFVVFVLLWVVSGYLPASNAVKLVIIATGAIVLGVWMVRRADAFGLALATAIAGPLVEIVLVRAGAFRHLQPDVFGIPMWLPALYACASLSFGALVLALVSGTPGSRQPR